MNRLSWTTEGGSGSFLKKKLQKDYVVIGSDINVRNNLIDKNYINDVFKKNKFYAVIFCHGHNSTPVSKNSSNDITNFDEKSIQKFFDVNFFLNLSVIKNYIKYQKTGRVMNFTSLYSIKAPKHFIYKNFSKEIGYSISKAASNMMMKFLGAKFAKKFLFNSIILGGVHSKDLSNFF